jgi:hypothetical protein
MEVNKLPKVFKKQWLKALKSGDYKQGTGSLISRNSNQENTYCCLGVAAHMCGSGDSILRCKYFIKKGEGLRGISKIPDILKGDSGLPETLAQLNDAEDNFELVIEFIENNL